MLQLEPGKVSTRQSSTVFHSPHWPLLVSAHGAVLSIYFAWEMLLLDPAYLPGLVISRQGSRDLWNPFLGSEQRTRAKIMH